VGETDNQSLVTFPHVYSLLWISFSFCFYWNLVLLWVHIMPWRTLKHFGILTINPSTREAVGPLCSYAVFWTLSFFSLNDKSSSFSATEHVTYSSKERKTITRELPCVFTPYLNYQHHSYHVPIENISMLLYKTSLSWVISINIIAYIVLLTHLRYNKNKHV
jgi:hypothetical protein